MKRLDRKSVSKKEQALLILIKIGARKHALKLAKKADILGAQPPEQGLGVRVRLELLIAAKARVIVDLAIEGQNALAAHHGLMPQWRKINNRQAPVSHPKCTRGRGIVTMVVGAAVTNEIGGLL